MSFFVVYTDPVAIATLYYDDGVDGVLFVRALRPTGSQIFGAELFGRKQEDIGLYAGRFILVLVLMITLMAVILSVDKKTAWRGALICFLQSPTDRMGFFYDS